MKKTDYVSDGGVPDASYRLLLEGLCEGADRSLLDPATLAEKAYDALDPERKSPPEVRALAIQQLSKLAWDVCVERQRNSREK